MNVIKTFRDQYGHPSSNFHELVLKNVDANGTVEADICFDSFVSEEAKNNGEKRVDYFQGTKRFHVTDVEIENAEGNTLGEKTRNAFLEKAMESVLEENEGGEMVETNLFNGNIGQIGFQDAVISES